MKQQQDNTLKSVYTQYKSVFESVGANINQASEESLHNQSLDNVIQFDDKEMMSYIENEFAENDALNKHSNGWEYTAFMSLTPEAKIALNDLVESIGNSDSRAKKNIRDAKTWKGFPVGIILEKEYDDEVTNDYYLQITVKYVGVNGWSGFFAFFNEFTPAAKLKFIKYLNLAYLMAIPSGGTDNEFMDSEYHKDIADNYKQEWIEHNKIR